jgi:2-aminoadipate transaminase
MSEPRFSRRARGMQPSAIRSMTKLAAAAGPELITFAGGMPNPATFPLDDLAEIAASELREHGGRNLQYGMTTGYRPLVQWIAQYLGSQDIKVSPGEVLCTTGSQQAIDLITDVLIDPDDFIFVESPTYLGALSAFQKSAAHIISVKQDDKGIELLDLEEKLKRVQNGCAKLIYVSSNFQNPSGISLIHERREKLANLLDRHDAYLIEDDPYGELYYGEQNRPGRPIKFWNSERILLLGTFSKLVAPTFRTGWVAASPPLLSKIELAKEAADLCGSMLDQRILYRFCSASSFPEHLAGLRDFYAERREAMLAALEREMPKTVSWTHPQGGFFIWLTLPKSLDAESILEESISREKVSYVIGRPFTADNSARNYLRLAFSVENPDRISEGIKRLGALIRRHL